MRTILMLYACMKNVDVIEDDMLNERMHYWVICSCIHKCQLGYLYLRKTIRILCIQEATIMIQFCIMRRPLWYSCIKRRRLVPQACKVGSRMHYIHLISVILATCLVKLDDFYTWWNLVNMWRCGIVLVVASCMHA